MYLKTISLSSTIIESFGRSCACSVGFKSIPRACVTRLNGNEGLCAPAREGMHVFSLLNVSERVATSAHPRAGNMSALLKQAGHRGS